MTTDLYAILGVKRGARPKTIERAWRKKAMLHHPDRGGDREEFERCSAAWEVLRDPERRRRYDETGDTSKPRTQERLDEAAAQHLLQCLLAVLTELEKIGKKPEQSDLPVLMRDKFASSRSQLLVKRGEVAKHLGNVKRMLGRFNVLNEENLLDGFFVGQQSSLERQLAQVDGEVRNLDAAAEMLKRYTYKADPTPPQTEMSDFVKQVQAMLRGEVNSASAKFEFTLP